MNSTYWINKIMTTMFTNNTSLYIGLSTTYPGANGTGAKEPSGNNYERVRLTSLSSPSNGVVYNTTELTFPKSTGHWFYPENRASCWVVFDGNTSGANVLCAGTLEPAIAVRGNATVTIPAGQIRISIRDLISS